MIPLEDLDDIEAEPLRLVQELGDPGVGDRVLEQGAPRRNLDVRRVVGLDPFVQGLASDQERESPADLGDINVRRQIGDLLGVDGPEAVQKVRNPHFPGSSLERHLGRKERAFLLDGCHICSKGRVPCAGLAT